MARRPRMMSNKLAWEEKYRPKFLRQVILPERILNALNTYIAEENCPNLILTSRSPGTGKTSTAVAYANTLEADMLFIKAGENNRKDTVSGEMNSFSSSATIDGKPKIIILDEADSKGGDAFQDALKGAIEGSAYTTRYIFTCNSYEKILPALKSRCKTIDFNRTEADKIELIPKLKERLLIIAKQEVGTDGIVEETTIDQIIEKNYPDMRAMIVDMQFCFMENSGSIRGDFISSNANVIPQIVDALKAGKLLAARKLYIENVGDSVKFHIDFLDWCLDNMPEYLHAAIATEVGESARWDVLSVNDELNVAAVLFGKLINMFKVK